MSEPAEPVLRVVKGDPSAEELAAVLAVLTAATGPPVSPEPSTPGGWSAYWRSVRAPLIAGPGAWRSSGRLG